MSLSLSLILITASTFTNHPQHDHHYAPYPICSGEINLGDISNLSRTGDMELQLSPAFLDEMKRCRKADRLPPSAMTQPKAGVVNAKGDCEWKDSGVVCHYHNGVEFVYSQDKDRPKRGELHCIFPDAIETNSPRVYGGQFTCSKPEQEVDPLMRSGKVNEGAACGEGLLTKLHDELNKTSVRCCDDGTLTPTAEERKNAGTLGVRPDFRISAKPLELDCHALEQLTGHAANAPKFGEPVDNDFHPSEN